MNYSLGNFIGSGGILSKPNARRINFVGDSITDIYNVNISATNRRKYSNSFIYWALLKSQYAFDSVYNPTGASYGWGAVGTYEFATYGASCSQIMTEFLTPVNNNPGNIINILAGANDLGNLGRTAAQTFAQIQNMITTFKSNGHNNFIICALTPRTSALNPTSPTDGKTFAVRVQETNALLAAWCPTVGIKFCDWTASITDSNGFWLSGYTDDGVHPNTLGSQIMGNFYADFIDANYSINSPILNTNFISTLNSQNSPTSGWTLFTYNVGAPASATQTTIAGTDGLGDWRRVTTTHSDPSINYTQFYRNGMTLNPEWGIVDGDLIQAVAEVRLLSSVSNSLISMTLSGNSRSDLFLSQTSTRRVYDPFQGVVLGQPFAVTSTTTLNGTVDIKGSMSFDIRRFGFRKVNSMQPPYI